MPALLGLAAYTLLTLAYLRPIWRVGGDHIAPAPGDPVFNLWVLSWGAHQVREGLPDFWDANIFYPTRGALTFSDHLFGPAVQLAAFQTLVPNPIAGYNLLFFTSFVASAFATAWVLRRAGRSWTAALLAGWMFAFSPFRLMHLNHIQILIAQWLPLTLWFWDRLLAERTAKAAALFLVFYLLHVSGGCYLAYMIHVPMAALLAVRLREHGRTLLAPRSLRVLLPTGFVAAAALAALFLPYIQVSHRLGLSRSPEEAVEYAATTASWLSPEHRSVYWGGTWLKNALRERIGRAAVPFFRIENSLFPGFLPTLLALAGLALWWREQRAPSIPLGAGRRAILGALLALSLVAWIWGDLLTLARPAERSQVLGGLGRFGWGAPALLLVLALGAWSILRRFWAGPLLQPVDGTSWERGIALGALLCFALAYPIAYVPLMRVVPGLDGMRVPARFAAFVSFTLVAFAALGTDRLLERLRDRRARAAVAAALALLLTVELAPRRVRWVPLLRQEELPAVYPWIAGRDEIRALIELPVRPGITETEAMYASTLHWKPIVNGYSGFLPPLYEEIARRMRVVPDRAGIALLRRLGVTHLVIHPREMQGQRSSRLLARFERETAGGPAREVEIVWSSPGARVYRILPSSSTPNRAGLWKSAGRTSVGDQALCSTGPSAGRSIRLKLARQTGGSGPPERSISSRHGSTRTAHQSCRSVSAPACQRMPGQFQATSARRSARCEVGLWIRASKRVPRGLTSNSK